MNLNDTKYEKKWKAAFMYCLKYLLLYECDREIYIKKEIQIRSRTDNGDTYRMKKKTVQKKINQLNKWDNKVSKSGYNKEIINDILNKKFNQFIIPRIPIVYYQV